MPQSFGPWRVERTLGAGARGVVLAVRHRERPQAGALKLEAVSGGLAEAALVARLARRWGPRLLDAGWTDATDGAVRPYWVMDHVEGVALTRARRGSRSARRAMALAAAHGVAGALAELHAMGVRHGDVKPDNVVGTFDRPTRDAAEARTATLVDLDLARLADDTLAGGTPRYVAPEALDGAPVGAAADMWSLGVVLAELVVGDDADARSIEALRRSLRDDEETESLIRALIAPAATARPRATWVREHAARLLGLAPDRDEDARARVAEVERTYVAAYPSVLAGRHRAPPTLSGRARALLDEAAELASRLAERASVATPHPAAPLDAIERALWLARLVGAAAIDWPILALDESQLFERALELAAHTPPAAWAWDDFVSPAEPSVAAYEPERWADAVALALALTHRDAPPDALVSAEQRVHEGDASDALRCALASALMRRGDVARARAALVGSNSDDATLLRAEVARRSGDLDEADAIAAALPAARSAGLRARIAWDRGDDGACEAHAAGRRDVRALEARALLAWRRGAHEEGLAALAAAARAARDDLGLARVEGVRGMLEHGRGRSDAALGAFERAADLADRAGALVEEATYLTGVAAAAVDVGDASRALGSSRRAALLWERLGREDMGARAVLARAASLALFGATAEVAALRAMVRGRGRADALTSAYFDLALLDAHRIEGSEPDIDVSALWSSARALDETARMRVGARVLALAPALIAEEERASFDAATEHPVDARLEWLGARARDLVLADRLDEGAGVVLVSTMLAVVDASCSVAARLEAFHWAEALARALGHGEAAGRFAEAGRSARARVLGGAPRELAPLAARAVWARGSSEPLDGVGLGPDEVGQLAAVLELLSMRGEYKELLARVADSMLLWSGAERALVLVLRADGQLSVRIGRNFSVRSLGPDQRALSMSLARRALEAGDAVVATDASSEAGAMHQSVAMLKLRSVLAVPLRAGGAVLGVVYLDNRSRAGAFGPKERRWVKLLATLAATALSDARDRARLRRAERALRRAERRADSVAHAPREALQPTPRSSPERSSFAAHLVGTSGALVRALAVAERVSASVVPALIVGESGTGKELVARAIHEHSPVRSGPFVTENCAAVPDALIEATLFGHVRGAFTGAYQSRAGLFELADGGTLLLDEIGEMPLSLQAKLLRVLEDGEVRRVGATESRRVRVRVLCATHRDLAELVRQRRFREDLLYRLDVVRVELPPLRERREDIPLLVAHFLERYASGPRPPVVTDEAREALVRHAWPGNVRQLENAVRRALVLGDGTLRVADLGIDARAADATVAHGSLELRPQLDALTRLLVERALAEAGNNRTRAAELLGLSRFGLQKMLQRLAATDSSR